MEKIDEIKPPSPYHRNIQEILQIESKYDVEHWYESLKEFTFPTYFLPLFANEAKAICNQYKYRFLKGDKIKENDILLLENVKTRINLAMKQYFGEKPIFLRLSTRSPKDSALDFSNSKTNEKYLQGISEILIKMGISNISLQERMKQSQSEKMDTDYFLSLLSDEESNAILVYLMNATKTTLKVSTSFEALQLLTSSERVVIDIHHMLVYKNCDEKESDLELCKIVLREWVDLNDLDEFRCFFFQKKLTAISQYNFYIYDKSLKENTEYIKQRIYEEFMKLVSYLNVENGVIDFAVQKNRTWLIELNPFNDYKGAGTGGALFFWKEDINIIKNGPLEIRVVEKLIPNCSHRISIFGAENLVVQSLKSILENNSKKNNQCNLF